ncbi:hypothetical protein D9M73_160330 [compost metagenome]
MVHALGQAADEVQCASGGQRGHQFLVAGLAGTEGEVFPQGAVEQPRVLRQQADVTAQVSRVEVGHGDAVQADLALYQVHGPTQRLQQG